MQSNLIEIVPRQGCFPANLLHIFKTPFPKNTSGRLLLKISIDIIEDQTKHKTWTGVSCCPFSDFSFLLKE